MSLTMLGGRTCFASSVSEISKEMMLYTLLDPGSPDWRARM